MRRGKTVVKAVEPPRRQERQGFKTEKIDLYVFLSELDVLAVKICLISSRDKFIQQIVG